MSEKQSKGNPEERQTTSSELGVLDAADIRKYHSEGEKILEIEKILDKLIEQDNNIQRLAERVQSPEATSDGSTKKVSQLILSKDVMADFQAVLVAAHEAHSKVFLYAEKTLRPFLKLDSEGSKDLTRIAAHQALTDEGKLKNDDGLIIPGSFNDSGYTLGNVAFKRRVQGLLDADEARSQRSIVPDYRLIERNRLARKAKRLEEENIADLEKHGPQRKNERDEAVFIIKNIEQLKLDEISITADSVNTLIHVLEMAEQAFLFGSTSLQLQAEKMLSAFQRYAKNETDETKQTALEALREFEAHANFKKRRDDALDKLKDSSRELKEELLKVEQKVQGISAISRLFETSDKSEKVPHLSQEVVSRLKEQYDQAQSNYDRARDQLQSDEEGSDTAEALALVDFINSANLKEYFATEFYKTISDITKKLEEISKELRILQTKSSKPSQRLLDSSVQDSSSHSIPERRLDLERNKKESDDKKNNEESEFFYYEFKEGEKILELPGVPWLSWAPDPSGGIIIRKGNKILLNGIKLLYQGELDSWKVNPDGEIIIQRGNKILLNGTHLLYEGEFDSWELGPGGVIIKKAGGDGMFGKKADELINLNNGKTLYKGKFDSYKIQPDGGFVIQKDNKFRLNGKEILYKGRFDSWETHPDGGIIIENGNEILLNGTELLYEGEFDDWAPHPDGGVIILNRNKWTYHDLRQTAQNKDEEGAPVLDK